MSKFFSSIPAWVWSLIILGAFAAYYYIANIRNYKKNRDEILKFQNSLKAGERVILSSGIHGIVKSIDKKTAEVEITPAVTVIVERLSIASYEEEPDKKAA